jgi:hypothetical protein
VDKKFYGGFDHVAVAKFRNATAGKFELFTASNEGFELAEGVKNRAFAFVDLGGEPIIVFADSLLAGFDSIGRGGIGNVGPLVTERSAAANVVGVVLWTRIGMSVDYDDVFEFVRG